MALQLNNGVTNEYARHDGAGTGINGENWGFCCWLMRDTDTGTDDHPVGAYSDFSGGGSGYGMKVVNGTPDNYAQWKFGDSDTTIREANLATWIFLAYRASSIFDGTSYHGTATTLTGVASNVGASVILDSLHIGSYPSGSNPFKGRIAHLRFWSGAAPTQAEFEAEMVSTTAVKTANLYAAYEFANDSGTYLNDSSGNGRHLTGTNLDFATNYIDGPLAGGASVVISSLNDSTLYSGQTGMVITGTGFGASQGSGQVIVSPTDNVNDSSAVLQTVTSWGDTSITITAVQKHLAVNVPYYLFVKTDGAVSNESGFSVMYKFLGPITPRTFARAQAATLSGTGDVTP